MGGRLDQLLLGELEALGLTLAALGERPLGLGQVRFRLCAADGPRLGGGGSSASSSTSSVGIGWSAGMSESSSSSFG